MSNRLGNNGGRFYSTLNRPILIDCNFVVDSTNGNGLGIRSLKGANVRNVFMNTSATPAKGADGFLNPNPAAGYALIQLKDSYNRYAGGFAGFADTGSGSNVAINGSALTIGQPYIITGVGTTTTGTFTIAPVADSSGSLASTYFVCFDQYGNTYCVWFSVSGVGKPPALGAGVTYVQQSISTNDTAATIGADLVITLENLIGPNNPAAVDSYTASGTTTVTVVGTASGVQFPGGPYDGATATGFTFALTKYLNNTVAWQKVGLPAGIVPAVNATFVATATGYSTGGTSSGTVKVPAVSGITNIEVVGDPNLTINSIPMGGSPNVGGWILVQFMGATSPSVTTPIATAPLNGTVVSLSFYLEAGSTTIAGE